MRYHVNLEGNTGVCTATIQCPFGDLEIDHYPTEEAARTAYSNKVEKILKDVESTSLEYETAKKENARLSRKKKALIKKIHKRGSKATVHELSKTEKDFKNSVDDVREKAYSKRKAAKIARNMGLIETTPYDNTISTGDVPSLKISFDESNNDSLVIKELSAWTNQLNSKEIAEKLSSYDPDKDGSRDEYVVSLFQEYADKPRKMVFIDIETSGFSPTTGEIIEVGIVVVDKNGDISETIDERFDLEDSETRRILGTGPVHIHGIEREDLEGKPSFTNNEIQEKFKKILNDPDSAICAHNDSFERRWLNHYLSGFAEKHDKNNSANILDDSSVIPIQDTMNITKMLIHNASNNRLEGFAEANGVPYEDSHSAFPDAMMTAKAYINFRKELAKSPKGKRPNITDVGFAKNTDTAEVS